MAEDCVCYVCNAGELHNISGNSILIRFIVIWVTTALETQSDPVALVSAGGWIDDATCRSGQRSGPLPALCLACP